MRFYCTKGLLLLLGALLLVGAAACTQQKPAVPTPTLVPLNQTPVLPASATDTPGSAQVTPPVAVGTVAPPEATEPGIPAQPTLLPTPTTGIPPAQPTQAPPPATAVPPPPSSGSSGGTAACPNPYTVQRGDWLYQIARKCGVSPQALMAANPTVNPNLVVAGMVLQIPTGGGAPPPPPSGGGSGRTYVVQPGDTLFSIATRYGVTVSALMAANGIANPSFIFAGQVLIIP